MAAPYHDQRASQLIHPAPCPSKPSMSFKRRRGGMKGGEAGEKDRTQEAGLPTWAFTAERHHSLPPALGEEDHIGFGVTTAPRSEGWGTSASDTAWPALIQEALHFLFSQTHGAVGKIRGLRKREGGLPLGFHRSGRRKPAARERAG